MIYQAFRNLKLYLTMRANDEKGVTAVEYAVMIALIATVVAFSAPNIGSAVNNVFSKMITKM